MKILADVTANYIAGFQTAAEKDGHTWYWWDERYTPAFDVFDEVQPDLVFYCNATRALMKCINKFQPRIIQQTQNPFLFVIDGEEKDFGHLVDTNVFHPMEPDDRYAADLGIVCEPDPMLINLCYNSGDNQTIRIISNTAWPVSQYIGIGTIHDKCRLYNNSDFVIVDTIMEAIRAMACKPRRKLTTNMFDVAEHFDNNVTYIEKITSGPVCTVSYEDYLDGASYEDAWEIING